MKMSLQEQAEACAALSDFFERLWPGPDAGPETLSFEKLSETEQRCGRAQQTGLALKQGEQAQSGTKQDEELKTPR